MIVGHGIDVVKKSRIQKIFSRYGKKFAYKILNTQEMNDFLNSKHKTAFLAKRFAAKEAFAKALGTGFRMKLNFKDIEVVNDKMGKPNYVTNKKITKMIQNKFKIKKYNCFLSISDEKKYSTAFAIIQS